MIMSRSLNGYHAAVNSYSGLYEVQDLMLAGLGHMDSNDVLQPQLAEAVPTLDNGQWKLQPDGGMELTWRLKPNLTWHDGAPFTSDDLLFTAQVMQDKEVGVVRTPTYNLIDHVEAPDPRTVTVFWKQPYINANTMFSMAAANSLMVPMPKHILEGPYNESKATLHENPYFLSQFIGTGAYRMKQYSDTGLVLEAWNGYVFGRPKIDEIGVRWVTDPNTYVANILAGTADLTVGPGLTVEQALLLKNQWNAGRVDTLFRFWIRMNPQLMDADPAAIYDLRFRQALTYAMDRQAMVETLQAGIAPVAHVWLNPTHPLFKEVEPSIVKYEFDPRRATQLIEEMGFRKDAATGTYRDGSGQPLTVEMRALESLDIQVKGMLSVADYWKRLGVGVETVAIPRQRETDRAYRSTFPGFEVTRFNTDVDRLSSYHSTMIPTKENNYAGQNRSRYPSPELDGLIDRYFSTIQLPARTQILGQVVHQVSEQLIVMGMFHDPEYAVVSNRMVNVAGAKGDLAPVAWNVQDWDMK